ncbi:pyridoxal phosphate-dependent transferase [Sphaerosporella brunnea]|uniref:histidinol-phosphate transaminase n=1 Tax=Sphaerosporella brunnea TaxID=1250544 RepID=A0A5J5EGU1_9PEZI|nr:pyridoxal phosphate-dependent transferase [Sphaerosporella brunnea]
MKLQPAHFSLEYAIRPNVLATSASITSTYDESQPRTSVVLDANENPFGSCLTQGSFTLPMNGSTSIDSMAAIGFAETASLHRYPSASQAQLKSAIAAWKGLPSGGHVCLGIGASDLIDLTIRITCRPTRDAIMITPPSFPLYKARADLNEVNAVECPLKTGEGEDLFQLRMMDQLHKNPQIKVVFLASPGNPTGTLIPLSDIRQILDFPSFRGLVVVDEAYIDFSDGISALSLLDTYNNLVVIQTFSKMHGLAGIRVGAAFAHPDIVEMMHRMQMPYSISTPSSTLALLALSPAASQARRLAKAQITANRASLRSALAELNSLGVGVPLDGGHANFLLVPILKCGTTQRDGTRARTLVTRLKEEWAVSVRYVGEMPGLQACLRIAVGTKAENARLVEGLLAILA